MTFGNIFEIPLLGRIIFFYHVLYNFMTTKTISNLLVENFGLRNVFLSHDLNLNGQLWD